MILQIKKWGKTVSEANDKKQTEGMTVKRNIKDCVFTNMFGDKKYLIQVHWPLYIIKGIESGIDVTVNMLYGEKDDIIGEYVTFTKVYNEQCRIHGRTEEAVKRYW